MAHSDTDVPGTVYLVDGMHVLIQRKAQQLIMNTASGNLRDAAHAGQDILLIPQPTASLTDPLVSIHPLRVRTRI